MSSLDFEKEINQFMACVESEKPSLNAVFQDCESIKPSDKKKVVFWYFDESHCKISNHLIMESLIFGGFRKIIINSEADPLTVRIDGVFIEKVNDLSTIDYLKSVIEDESKTEFKKVFDCFTNWYQKTNLKKIISLLPVINPVQQIDSRFKAFYFFKNCYAEITPETISTKDYSDFNGYIWREHALNYDFSLSAFKGEFEQFCENTQRDKLKHLDPKRWNNLRSVLGYALHKYHNPSNARACLFFDEKVRKDKSEANGGTGKSIIGKAILKMRKGTKLDGKQLDFKKDNFHYDLVNSNDLAIFFDDIKDYFPFEELFNQIESHPKLNHKNKRQVNMDTIPKFIISSNGLIDLNSWSFQRRAVAVFTGEYYGKNLTPSKEFKHNLFDDWQSDQWNLFFNFMLNCLQYHLKLMHSNIDSGLVFFEPESYKQRVIIENWSIEASDWLNENIQPEKNSEGIKLEFKSALDDYISFTGENKMDQRNLSKLIKRFCQVKDYNYSSDASNGQRFYIISTITKNSTNKSAL